MYALVAPNPNNYLDNDSFMLPQYGMVKSSIINLTKYLASYYGRRFKNKFKVLWAFLKKIN